VGKASEGDKARIEVFNDQEGLSRWAAGRFVQLAAEATRARGRFLVALSGGSTPQRLYQLLAQPPHIGQVQWQYVHWFWGDERCVPPDDPGSNYHSVEQILLSRVPFRKENLHRVKGELTPEQAAQDYAKQLRAYAEPGRDWPRFDLVLLGMGGDGHTASLFPGSDPALEVESSTLAVTGHYQGRPAQRVTLTSPVFNAAGEIFFLLSGKDKAETLARVLSGPHQPVELPAQRIRPTDGHLTWLVDKAAASRLSKEQLAA
jgi:6-phosphogluconolactonase